MNTNISTIDNNIILQTSDVGNMSIVQDTTQINSISTDEVRITFTDVGAQGLPGAKGDTGAKGDKGDALVYNLLTPEQKSEVIAQFDSTVGTTSYANIFLDTYLS